MKEKILLRSMLFVPGNSRKYIEKSVQTKADALILDFEDSIPEFQKDEARSIVTEYLNKGIFHGKKVFVRTNSLDSADFYSDMKCCMHEDISGFMPPKITSKDDIVFLDKLLSQMESEHSIETGHFKLTPLVETTGAVLNLSEIVSQSDRLIAICFGGDDYINDLAGTDRESLGSVIAHRTPKSLIAMSARAADIWPIDTPFLRLNDIDGLKNEKDEAYSLGMGGALIINPKHIDVVNECFTPTKDEIEQAYEILDAIEKSKQTGAGCVMLGERMIGPPKLRRATRIVDLMELIREQGQ